MRRLSRRIPKWIAYVGLALVSALLCSFVQVNSVQEWKAHCTSHSWTESTCTGEYTSIARSLSSPSSSLVYPSAISSPPPQTLGFVDPGEIASLAITIAGDPADLYLPVTPDASRSDALPIALMLPGALVHRSYYSQFASAVAGHGFAVVVPTHERSLPEFNVSGELAEASQITETLGFLQQETVNPSSPLYQKLDSSRMVLLGHSHGGAVGLNAIANTCMFPFCTPPFSRPDAVVAGIFYGVNSQNPTTGEFRPTANNTIPVALVQGSLDGVATPDEAIATYDLIETPPKALITIEGTNHYGITNVNNPPGAFPDASSPTLEQTQGVEAIAQWTGYFLRAHVYGDVEARERIYGGDRPYRSAIISVLE